MVAAEEKLVEHAKTVAEYYKILNVELRSCVFQRPRLIWLVSLAILMGFAHSFVRKSEGFINVLHVG